MEIKSFKICIIGSGGTGKTTWLNRLENGDFTKNYAPTFGVNVTQYIAHTTKGPINFHFWDCAGKPQNKGLGDGYFIGSDGAIIFQEYSEDINSIAISMKSFHLVTENKPLVVVSSKCDLLHENAENKAKLNVLARFHRERDVKVFLISAKSNYNLETPLLSLARILLNDQDLAFLDAPNQYVI